MLVVSEVAEALVKVVLPVTSNVEERLSVLPVIVPRLEIADQIVLVVKYEEDA